MTTIAVSIICVAIGTMLAAAGAPAPRLVPVPVRRRNHQGE